MLERNTPVKPQQTGRTGFQPWPVPPRVAPAQAWAVDRYDGADTHAAGLGAPTGGGFAWSSLASWQSLFDSAVRPRYARLSAWLQGQWAAFTQSAVARWAGLQQASPGLPTTGNPPASNPGTNIPVVTNPVNNPPAGPVNTTPPAAPPAPPPPPPAAPPPPPPPAPVAVAPAPGVQAPMPAGTLDTSRFTEVFRDDFRGPLDRNVWNVYNNVNGPNGAFTFSADDVKTGPGGLTVDMTRHPDGKWSVGGLNTFQGFGPGLYQYRARVDAGQGTGPCLVLWPHSNQWPGPEIDLVESAGGHGDRQHLTYTVHWKGLDGSDQYDYKTLTLDATQYHTYALDWQADKMTYYIDGQALYTTSEHLPQENENIGLEGWVYAASEQWAGGAPDATTPGQVHMNVDWVSYSKPRGGG